MNKKLLNEDNILNELKGGSSFFKQQAASPVITESQKDLATTPVVPLESRETPSADESSSPTLKEPEASELPGIPQLQASQPASTQADTQTSMDGGLYDSLHACMQEILQESADLKRAGGQSLSVRVPTEDFKWLRNVTNSYNDELNQKFNQGLFVRIGLKFLKKAMMYDPQTVKALLEEIK